MTHLYIELNTGLTEEVNSSIISKLYELASSGDLDNTSDLKGRLHASIAKEKHVSYLNENFDELYITADVRTLSFEDPVVENICITNWGSNGDITANQLNEVTNASTLFKNNTTILSFNEFQYFTSVGNNYSFSGCTSLQEITLPPAKTTIVNDAFCNCTSLQTFDFANITSVGNGAFYDCSTTQFSNLDHIISYGNTAFHGCSAITSVEFPANVFFDYSTFAESGVLSITFKGDFLSGVYGGIFEGCNRLTSVTFETQFSALPFRFFNKCGSLQTVDLSNCLSYRISDNDPFFGGQFNECGSLITVTLSPHVNKLEFGMFRFSALLYITIPANVTEIANTCFLACRNATITCLPTTPPTLTLDNEADYYLFDMVPIIKVPAASLEAYKTATGWSKYASAITAIPLS